MGLLIIFIGLITYSYCTNSFSNETRGTFVPVKRAISSGALSGSTTSAYETGYKLHLEWSAVQRTSALASTITATFYLEITNTAYYMYNLYTSGSNVPSLVITIGGATVLNTVKTFDFRNKYAGYTDARGSGSRTIGHNADGSVSGVSISATFNTGISTKSIASISTTASLNTITVTVIINFNGNGGTVSKSSMSATYGRKYGNLTIASREGYTFNGWYTSPSGGSEINSSSTVSVTSAQTLYAKWTPNNYTINFNGNGGTASKSSISVTYASTYGTLSTATRDGYHFEGWFTNSSGGSEINSSSTVSVTSAQTLYAHWTPNNYTVFFDVNSANEHKIPSKEVTYNNHYGELPIPNRTGYRFIGWFDANNESVTNETQVRTADNHTLYAQWDEIPSNKVEIVFKAHELTKKELLIIIKQYTDAVFSIVNFEITGNDELTAIIMFNDIESAKDFIDKIREDDGSVSEIIKKISFSFADISSYSLIFYPMTLGLQVLWIF